MATDPSLDDVVLLADLPARPGITLTAAGPGGVAVPCRDCPERRVVYSAAGSVALSVPLLVEWDSPDAWEMDYGARALADELRRWGYERVEVRRVQR